MITISLITETQIPKWAVHDPEYSTRSAKFFIVTIQDDSSESTFIADVRSGQHGLQVDWDDSLQNLLMANEWKDKYLSVLGSALADLYCGKEVSFPINLK